MNPEQLQWGMRVQLPDLPAYEEPAGSRGQAMAAVTNTNSTLGARVATVVYRTVEADAWRTGPPGDQWGVRVVWSDGHSYVEVADDRAEAERWTQAYFGAGVPQVVTRSLTYGPWRDAGEATRR